MPSSRAPISHTLLPALIRGVVERGEVPIKLQTADVTQDPGDVTGQKLEARACMEKENNTRL